MDPPSLVLYSYGLLSKWGFRDGDVPEELMDYWDEIGIPYPEKDWRTALQTLVRRYLLPEIRKYHDVRIYDIETSHNPIRAEMIDGIEIDDTGDLDQVTLTPESVTISYDDVMEVLTVGPAS